MVAEGDSAPRDAASATRLGYARVAYPSRARTHQHQQHASSGWEAVAVPFATKAIRDRARRRVAQRVRAGEPCALCHRPIDLSLAFPDPMSFVVDHSTPTSLGGTDTYDNCRPAHHRCNGQRSNLPTGTVGRNSGALDPGEGDPGSPGRYPARHRDTSGAPN